MGRELIEVTIWGPNGEPLWAQYRVTKDPPYQRNDMGFEAPSARETKRVRRPVPEAARGDEGPPGTTESVEE